MKILIVLIAFFNSFARADQIVWETPVKVRPFFPQQINQVQYVPAKIDLNTATKEELMRLYGIGAKKAEAILAYRQQHGPFTKLTDLSKIKGISPKTATKIIEKNKETLEIKEVATAK